MFRSSKEKRLQEKKWLLVNDCLTKEDNIDIDSAQFLKETLLNGNWCMKIDYILAFKVCIYDVLKKTYTNMDIFS